MLTKTTRPSEDFHNPYGYSDMDWAAQLDPAYAAARAEVRRLSVGEDGTLSVKVKEFVVMGVLASRGLQYGVEAHMRRVGHWRECLRVHSLLDLLVHSSTPIVSRDFD